MPDSADQWEPCASSTCRRRPVSVEQLFPSLITLEGEGSRRTSGRKVVGKRLRSEEEGYTGLLL